MCLVVAVMLTFTAPTEKPTARSTTYAPSLPPVTREDEDRFDDIIRRFSQADIGAIKGEPARKAIREFEALGPTAIPSLIRGLHKAAEMKHSCPVLMISKKLNRMLMGSQDPVLLEFARDELQAGPKGAVHAATVGDLRVRLAMRRNALERQPPPAADFYEKIPTDGLARLANAERGARKLAVLKVMATRDGREALLALARHAASGDATAAKAGRELLAVNLGRQSESMLKEAMTDRNPEVRKAAIRASAKERNLTPCVIDRLADERADVRAEAKRRLLEWSKGEDFGSTPAPWREWWKKQSAQGKD